MCVHNTPGRARILACRACRALARCERCEAAVGAGRRRHARLPALRHGAPGRCASRCGGVGVRQPQAGRDPAARGAGGGRRPAGRRRHRRATTSRRRRPGCTSAPRPCCTASPRADVVAFLDIDIELLAPRYRAAEQAMALLVRGGPARRAARTGGGRLLVQTFLPRHEVVQAALLADPGRLVEPRAGPAPAARPAAVRRPGRGQRVRAATRSPTRLRAVPGHRRRRRRAAATPPARAGWDELGRALIAAPRPKGARVRVAVDPPRA